MTRHTTKYARRAHISLACCAALMLTSAPAWGATFRVPELPSGPGGNDVSMHWKHPMPSMSSLVEGRLDATLRLNTAAWRGQTGRLYLYVPAQAIGTISVEWSSANNGPLMPGRLLSGQRGLLYSGVMPAVLEDTLAIRLEADGERLYRTQQLELLFEIDLEHR